MSDTIINVNHHINGELAGITDYSFAEHGAAKVLRHNGRTGKIELSGRATNSEWAQLMEAMVEDFFSVKGTF
jgi:hypothetical protein